MALFSRSEPAHKDEAARSGIDALRTDLLALRSLVLEQDTQIKLLQNERTLREAELMDLRTRFETVIKRVQARLTRGESLENEQPQSTFEFIRGRRR